MFFNLILKLKCIYMAKYLCFVLIIHTLVIETDSNNPKKNTIMKRITATLLALLCMISFSYAQRKKPGKLDRKTYEVEMLIVGKKKATIDEFKFVSGTFQCKLMTDDEFRASPYDATVDSSTSPPTITYTCTAKNAKDDQFTFTGTVKGDDIEGTADLVDKKGKAKKSYTYTGVTKGKKQTKE